MNKIDCGVILIELNLKCYFRVKLIYGVIFLSHNHSHQFIICFSKAIYIILFLKVLILSFWFGIRW